MPPTSAPCACGLLHPVCATAAGCLSRAILIYTALSPPLSAMASRMPRESLRVHLSPTYPASSRFCIYGHRKSMHDNAARRPSGSFNVPLLSMLSRSCAAASCFCMSHLGAQHSAQSMQVAMSGFCILSGAALLMLLMDSLLVGDSNKSTVRHADAANKPAEAV